MMNNNPPNPGFTGRWRSVFAVVAALVVLLLGLAAPSALADDDGVKPYTQEAAPFCGSVLAEASEAGEVPGVAECTEFADGFTQQGDYACPALTPERLAGELYDWIADGVEDGVVEYNTAVVMGPVLQELEDSLKWSDWCVEHEPAVADGEPESPCADPLVFVGVSDAGLPLCQCPTGTTINVTGTATECVATAAPVPGFTG